MIAVKARTMFILNIQKRGFEGRLDFNHYQERLAVKVCARPAGPVFS